MNSNSNNGGPKRCNCKKSMCLKLYCECFAAGFFCDENCSCKECFNSTDYEDTVHEAREQVNLRYPDAFSPKIHLLTDSPTSQNEIAGKHSKGCNCKKSKCKKNYCECYQAKVGCSDGCRCEGCENAFGIRERYNVYRRRLPINNQFNECHTPAEPANSVRYPNAEFLNQFTPQNTPQFNATHPFPSLTDLPPLMDWSNNPTSANGNFSSLNTVHWPGSQVNRAPLMFGGPTETMHDYTTNLQNVYNKTIHETTKNLMQSMGSRFSLPFQQLGHENNPPLSESYIPSLDSANCDMMLDRQSYPSFEFLNRFTPPMTGGPDSSGSCGDYSSVNSWSGLQMTPVSVSSGPKVNNSNQEPSTCRRCDFISDAFS